MPSLVAASYIIRQTLPMRFQTVVRGARARGAGYNSEAVGPNKRQARSMEKTVTEKNRTVQTEIYTVQKGDHLTRIARAFAANLEMDESTHVKMIYDLNMGRQWTACNRGHD